MAQSRERIFVIFILCILLISTVVDILEEIEGGSGVAAISLDLLVATSIAGLLLYIYVLEPLKVRNDNKRLSDRSQEQENDLERLSAIARKQLEGLGSYIEAQFGAWDLTIAEKDVALLLLKGFSSKEIADLRQVSERTIRQQATSIYGKAGLSGRTGLSAYFLEDLLLPSHNIENSAV